MAGRCGGAPGACAAGALRHRSACRSDSESAAGPRASLPAPALPVSPRLSWGPLARLMCCQMAKAGSRWWGGGSGACLPACRAGTRPGALCRQGSAVPAMSLRATGLQGSWQYHMEPHTAAVLDGMLGSRATGPELGWPLAVWEAHDSDSLSARRSRRGRCHDSSSHAQHRVAY